MCESAELYIEIKEYAFQCGAVHTRTKIVNIGIYIRVEVNRVVERGVIVYRPRDSCGVVCIKPSTQWFGTEGKRTLAPKPYKHEGVWVLCVIVVKINS